MSHDVLVKVEGVSKKFCRSLKRSLWYGVQDVSAEMFGRKGSHGELRKNEFWALNDVSFELKRGDCLGLVGPNGAGKSTLLKMLNGLVKPDKGHITMRGRVGALIELGAGFNPILTARENIYVNGSVLGFSKTEIDRKFDAIIDFAEIEEFTDTPVQNFSSGMKVRLGFAVAAQMEPDILLIDEVLAVGDAAFRSKCLRTVLNERGRRAAVFVSHSMPLVSHVSSELLLLERGFTKHLGALDKGILAYQELSQVRGGLHSPQHELEYCDVVISSKNKGNWTTDLTMETGESIDVRIRCKLRASVKDCAVTVAIAESDSRLAAQVYSLRSDFTLRNQDSKSEVYLRLEDLSLGSGRYYLNVAFAETDSNGELGAALGTLFAGAKLSVEDQFPGYAPFQLKGSWVQKNPHE